MKISEIKKAQFWSKVNDTGACWEWQGSKDKYGYGRFRLDAIIQSHRLAYQIINGEIPKGLHVLHECDNPSCVNPSHLFTGTHQDNMADKKAKGRSRVIGRTSKYLGVGWRKDVGKWRAYYRLNGRNIYIGVFDTEEEAAEAHNEKCREFGLLNDLNFLPNPHKT